jgi:hypothetical protein
LEEEEEEAKEEANGEAKLEVKLEVDVEMVYLHKSHHHHPYHCCSYSELDMFQYPVWMCCLQFPPIFAVYGLSPCVHPTFDVPVLLHPAGLAVQPAPHSAIYSAFAAILAPISHFAVEEHP